MDIKLTRKIYIENPYLKETNASIVDKLFKDDKFLIKLDRTIFFPHMSGGQPKDLGFIDDVEVLDTYEDGDDIIHITDKDIKSTNVKLSINWENRFDLMQQHTGQHILSASFKKLLNAKTIGFHMGDKYITIDLDLLAIDEKDLLQAEILSNKIVQSNFKVIAGFIDEDEVEDYDLSKVPSGSEKIRIVYIDNISSTACCGTHVSNTGEIGLIKIINTEKSRGKVRVSFICGNRALEDYALKNKYIQDISLSLSSGVRDVWDNFIKLRDDREVLKKENKNLREELISLKGESLFEKKKTIDNINYIIEDMKTIDKKELNIIASYLNNKDKTIQIYKLENENQAMFLISKGQDLDIDLKELFELVSKKIIVKGGGSEDKIQGVTSTTIIDKVIEMFFKHIKDYFNSPRS